MLLATACEESHSRALSLAVGLLKDVDAEGRAPVKARESVSAFELDHRSLLLVVVRCCCDRRYLSLSHRVTVRLTCHLGQWSPVLKPSAHTCSKATCEKMT